MKVALVHDYIKEYGGAERVLEALHEIYPDAPVFTAVYLPEFLGPHRERFNNWNIKTSLAQVLPFKDKLISPLRIIAPILFKSFDFSNFDVVIVSATGAYTSNNLKFKISNLKFKKPVQICYCHTPPRYLYGYATARKWKNNWIFRILGELANHFLRLIDFKSAQNVDFFIANSRNVAERIKKFYKKDSKVIYPPVEIGIRNKNHSSKFIVPNSYFLAGGRIARPKHIDLIIEACIEINAPLKIFGRGFAGYDSELRIKNSESRIKKSRIEFLGEVSDGKKLELMKNAKAFIIAAEDEDFGITPVEAMSMGTPVIAFKSGGVLESVVEGKTGLFFNELTVKSLRKAIKQFEKTKFNSDNIIKHAQKFSKENFKEKISTFVENKI